MHAVVHPTEESAVAPHDVWTRLAAPLPPGSIQWRQDGRASLRGNRYLARFVAYIDANTVRERLDAVVAGEWSLDLSPLPPVYVHTTETVAEFSFKASLTILGVTRDDVGTGRSPKSAATDAFKRAATRFGIGSELYTLPPNWVPVDGDGKFAKPLIDPQENMDKYHGLPQAFEEREPAAGQPYISAAEEPLGTFPTSSPPPVSQGQESAPSCPECGGRMWDNRASKRNPKAPDFKCRDRSCDGVIWPPRKPQAAPPPPEPTEPPPSWEPAIAGPHDDDDDLPF